MHYVSFLGIESMSVVQQRCRLLCVPEAAATAEGGLVQGTKPGKVIAFPHPKSGEPIQFLLLPNGDLCELQTLAPSGTKYGSFFVEQRVVSDGTLYTASIFDPKFLLLPILDKHKARFSPLEQILAGESAGLYMQLRACRKLDLAKICDVNDQLGDDMLLYRLDPGKVTAWLSQKVRRAQQVLEGMEARRLRTGVGSAFVEGFNPTEGPSAKGDTTQQEKNRQEGAVVNNEHTQTAVELVCDYLNDEWAAKVKEAFPGEKVDGGVVVDAAAPAAASVKRPAVEQSDMDKALELIQGKRSKTEASAGAAAAPAKQSLAQKRLEKVDKKGMKSLAAFFGKK